MGGANVASNPIPKAACFNSSGMSPQNKNGPGTAILLMQENVRQQLYPGVVLLLIHGWYNFLRGLVAHIML